MDFIDHIESLDKSQLSEMLATRILPSFLRTVRNHGFKTFSNETLSYWIVDMAVQSFRPTTMKRYLGALHNLYKTWTEGKDIDTGVEQVKFTILDDIQLNSSDGDGTNSDELKRLRKNIEAIPNLNRKNYKVYSKQYTYLHALQFLMIYPKATLGETVDMSYSDYYPDLMHIEDIKAAMRKAPQAKYVFPLEQGKRRNGAIVKDLLSGMHGVAKSAGMDFGSVFSRDSLTAIWITAAIREGVTYSEIRGLLKSLPRQYSFLSLIQPKKLSDQDINRILTKVAEFLSKKTTSWFVMRLRSGVSPDDIKLELKERKFAGYKSVQYYYPIIRKKKILKNRVRWIDLPVIPGILFFRIQYDWIPKMMSLIGDLAWCYRTSATPGSPYSAISQEEMKTFQKCVGTFSSDIEMEIINTLPTLEVGDVVMIDSGSALAGQQAVIRKVKKHDGNISYTLRLSDTEFIHWQEVTLPATSISKME